MVWNFMTQWKQIRTRTGVGLAACKRAFFENGCDPEKAINALRAPENGYVRMSI